MAQATVTEHDGAESAREEPAPTEGEGLTRRELRRRRLAETADGAPASVPTNAEPAEPNTEERSTDEPSAVAPSTEPAEPTEQAPSTEPGGLTPAEVLEAEPIRAGRNVPVAFGVGVGLVVAVVLSLVFRKEAFLALAFAVIVLAVFELRTALARVRIAIPVAPILVGAAGMVLSAYLVGPEALLVAFVATAGAVVVWSVLDAPGGRALRNASAAMLVVGYVPFLASFLALGLSAPDGIWRVVLVIALSVAADTGGYLVGVRFGRTPIAPSVSPKKSWEGLGGSFALGLVVSIPIVLLALNGSVWLGVLAAVLGVLAALLGDLAESLIKRDLGMKDMGTVLPGHGGVLDRVDSIIVVAPVVTLLLTAVLPA